MSREAQGRILLVIAAALFFFAILTYTINDFTERAQRQEAIIRESDALRAQDVLLIQEKAKLDFRNEKDSQERLELRGQFNTIIQALQRIEEAVQSSYE